MDDRRYELAVEDFRSAYALCPEAQVRQFLGRACRQEKSAGTGLGSSSVACAWSWKRSGQ